MEITGDPNPKTQNPKQVTVHNTGDPHLVLFLTPEGFVFSGGGPEPTALIVENCEAPKSLSVQVLPYLSHTFFYYMVYLKSIDPRTRQLSFYMSCYRIKLTGLWLDGL